MNDTVKKILAEKLESAKKREGLDNFEVAEILGFKSQHYAGKICSNSFKKMEQVPQEAWRAVQCWINSGLKLREYGEKRGKAPEGIHKPATHLSEKILEEKAIPEDMPLDRLKVIFDAINDLKQMGYRVDINIYEKEER